MTRETDESHTAVSLSSCFEMLLHLICAVRLTSRLDVTVTVIIRALVRMIADYSNFLSLSEEAGVREHDD